MLRSVAEEGSPKKALPRVAELRADLRVTNSGQPALSLGTKTRGWVDEV
jgi:hypothetical protein